jgi:hypothetical protein
VKRTLQRKKGKNDKKADGEREKNMRAKNVSTKRSRKGGKRGRTNEGMERENRKSEEEKDKNKEKPEKSG